MAKKVLLIGGTGAMGVYVTPRLLEMGYEVDVLSLDDIRSETPGLRYFVGNGMADDVLRPYLDKGYDTIIDYLIYNTQRFPARLAMEQASTNQLIYLSSYRIYADSDTPITEESGRLLDVSTDPDLLASDDYCIYKAKGEDFLRNSGKKNWTIVRPSITFSQRKFQLVTLEANIVVNRARQGKTVILPETARKVQGTLSWGGDVARMTSLLVQNPKAYGETYTLGTSEHHTWEELAEYYKDLIGLKVQWVDEDDYLRCFDPTLTNTLPRWQLRYDRLFNRSIDNSKVLAHTGIKPEEISTTYDALKRELSALPKDYLFPEQANNANMDAVLARLGRE